MGNRSLRHDSSRQNGAHGAYLRQHTKQEFKCLVQTCYGVLNYFKASKETINGKTYGSDDVIGTSRGLEELHRMVSMEYIKFTGCPMPFSAEEVGKVYVGCRKGNYKQLRDGQLITKGCHPTPLFPELETHVTAVLYAYWGRNQKLNRRLVKVGYTSQDLATYLRSLGRMYDPQLMASCPGSKDDEDSFHVGWKRFSAEPPGKDRSREWYWATDQMFALFSREWVVTAQFEELRVEALTTSPLFG